MSSADAAHWDASYGRGADQLSWFQEEPRTSLRLITALGLQPDDPIIDVGGGASPLAAALLDRGHRDVTVIDLSQGALDSARAQLGARADQVTWLCGDLRDFAPAREYAVWHDRAVLHFLTDPADQRHYADLAAQAVRPSGTLVIGTFALDGPVQCSGLPVQRYDADALATLLGTRFSVSVREREDHRTPAGSVQHFTWITATRAARG